MPDNNDLAHLFWETNPQHKDDRTTLGNKLRFAREQKRMTQMEVARLLRADQSTISLWERDEQNPRRHTLKRLAEIYDVPLADLLSASSFTYPGRNYAFDPDYYKAYDSVSKIGPEALRRFIRIVVLIADLMVFVRKRT